MTDKKETDVDILREDEGICEECQISIAVSIANQVCELQSETENDPRIKKCQDLLEQLQEGKLTLGKYVKQVKEITDKGTEKQTIDELAKYIKKWKLDGVLLD